MLKDFYTRCESICIEICVCLQQIENSRFDFLLFIHLIYLFVKFGILGPYIYSWNNFFEIIIFAGKTLSKVTLAFYLCEGRFALSEIHTMS